MYYIPMIKVSFLVFVVILVPSMSLDFVVSRNIGAMNKCDE